MTLAYVLLASLFCSLSMSYHNGLQLWKECPLIQSTTGSHGSHFEITKETFNNACKNLLPNLETENPSGSGIDIQLTSNRERVNITWNVQYENRCHRRIFLLDVEYRIRNSRGDGAYVDHYCFQYNLSKGEPERKETVTFYLDCICTVPDREAYLQNMTLWSLLPNSSASSRYRRSAKSQCSQMRYTGALKMPLIIGPIPSGKKEEANRKWCQCWANSSISLKHTTDTKYSNLLIIVANPNPYAAFIMVKMYKGENFTSPVFSVLSRLSSPAEVKVFLTNISCENGEGTYTPELMDQCYDSGLSHSINSECQPQYILGPAIVCRAKPHIPTSIDTHHIIIILPVSAGVIATVVVTVIVFLYRRAEQMNKPALTPANNSHTFQSASEETRSINHEGNYLLPKEDSEDEEQTVPSSSKHIMLLHHTDFTTTPVRKDCVDLITELLQAVGMKVLCLDRAQLYRNWIELAEKASKDDITEFLIIFSRELVSFKCSCLRSLYEAVCTELHDDRESQYVLSSVLKILRDRYFLPGRTPFRIHILSLEQSDNQMCKQYIDAYPSFMISECGSENRQNTYLYCFAKNSKDNKSFSFDETVLPSLLKRLKGITFPTKRYASKLKEKLLKLYGNKSSSTTGERTITVNCVAEDRESKTYSLETNVQSRPLFSESEYRRENLPFVTSEYIYRRENIPFVTSAN